MKNTFVPQYVCFQMLELETNLIQVIFNREKLLLSQNYVTSEGAVSHNILYYLYFYIAQFQVSFHADNYFEYQ